jgi:hypothetical protein
MIEGQKISQAMDDETTLERNRSETQFGIKLKALQDQNNGLKNEIENTVRRFTRKGDAYQFWVTYQIIFYGH